MRYGMTAAVQQRLAAARREIFARAVCHGATACELAPQYRVSVPTMAKFLRSIGAPVRPKGWPNPTRKPEAAAA